MEIKQAVAFLFTNFKKYALLWRSVTLIQKRFSEEKINFELLIAMQLHIVCSSIKVGVQVFPYI